MSRYALALALLAGVWFALYRSGGGKNNDALDALDVGASLLIAEFEGGSVVDMKLSAAGLDEIARREGFSAYRYQDADGFSIGFGHYILPGDFFHEPLSRDEGLRLLKSDAAIAERAVQAYVRVAISQSQFDALVSLTYNIGTNAFKKSTLLKLLNAGDVSGALAQFAVWNKSQGAVLPVLVARRADEAQQFLV